MTLAKVTINGEVFEWDRSKRPMAEAIAIEQALHCNYAVWEDDLRAGSARAMAGLVWLVLRRNGREVPIEDILSGVYPVDLNEMDFGAQDGDADPTSPSPGDSTTTGSDT